MCIRDSLYNDQGIPLTKDGVVTTEKSKEHAKVDVDLKDVKVGNSAQTTFAFGANYQVLKGLRLGADYTHWARNYAKFKLQEMCIRDRAYGDQCEACGTSLNATDLIDPVSAVTGNKPELKETKHWYLPLDRYEDWLKEWILEGHKEWKSNVYGQCKSCLLYTSRCV